MFEINGKYNSCKIFTDNCDNETIGQIIELLNQECLKNTRIRIMPDTHAGKGCVIGTTITLNDKVIPGIVGADIGCGMYALKLKETEIDYKKLDEVIRKYVPSGADTHKRAISTFDLSRLVAPINKEKILKSLGTLGGGNHFIEIDKGNDGHLWLVIHTGSRHLGTEICKYYQDLAYYKIRDNSVQEKIDTTVAKLNQQGKKYEIENTIKILKMQAGPIPKDLCYVEGKDFENYLNDMKITQEYASVNRQVIANTIIKHMNLHIVKDFQTIHNYIDTDSMILRKGAISSKKGEEVIIPMNMRDGSLICLGKGNSDWNYSAPHGAGRIMSRGKAKEIVQLEDFVESMSGIYTTSVGIETLDESPFVYKPMEEILNNIVDTVDVVDIIKPTYNFKASEKLKDLEQTLEEEIVNPSECNEEINNMDLDL